MADSPAHGDVVITIEGARHFLSVAPHPPRLSFANHDDALEIARRWSEINNVAIWQADGGVLTKLPRP